MKNTCSGQSNRSIWSMALGTAVLGGFLLIAGASGAKAADGKSDYDRQVQYTDWRAHEAAERFGYNSREARYWRHENHEARERERHYWHEYREHHRHDRDYDRDRDRD